ncbi:MAG TPA: permease, partial [Myxococcaceae bacterium]|nr:permease [Myxococcaceae bacterium]
MRWGVIVFRSLVGRPRTLLIALLAAGAAALLTLGAAVVGSVYEGTRRSIIESGAGHLQLYSEASANPPVAIPGPGGVPDLEPIKGYAEAEKVVRAVPGVKDLVPMELGEAQLFRGNYLDVRLQSLRRLVSQPASPEREAAVARMVPDLRRVLEQVARDGRQRDVIFTTGKAAQEDQRAIETATTDAFWERFRTDPFEGLEYIENRVSKQLGEGESAAMSFIGTEVSQFASAFPRIQLVSGALPPPGKRGILLGKGFHEATFKLPIAQRLDEISRAREGGGGLATDERLRTLLDRNAQELPYLLLTLDVVRAEAARATLSRLLGRQGELEPLLRDFLAVDDANFDERYRLFYAELAPHLPIYRVMPGDTLMLQSGTGSVRIPVRVYGTFRFVGLGSDQDRVNTVNLVDPITAQFLAMRQTRAQAEEARALISQFDLPPVPAADELELSPATVEDARPIAPSVTDALSIEVQKPPETFTRADVEAGGVLQAAVVLEPGAEPDRVAHALSERLRASGLPVKTAGWQEVGGFVGQVVELSRVAFFVAALV